MCYFQLKSAHFGIASMLKQIPSLLGHCHLIFFFLILKKERKKIKAERKNFHFTCIILLIKFNINNMAYKI